ncbi:MAG: GGDEF domain-containing protein [Clostridia bacterium]|nr:GGDEF domain-containing protein [Clostridia bacterium]
MKNQAQVSPKKPKQHDGISLRAIQICLIIAAVVFSALMLFFTFYLSSDFEQLHETSELHIEMRKAALDLMDTSDYLTEKVQRFTIDGETRFLDDYFEEALEMHHREAAIDKMSKGDNTSALAKLEAAMDGSMKLMEREYYAMRLVIEAKDCKDYPQELKSIKLSAEDQALSAENKMRAATKMVLGNDYYMQKNEIRNNMRACLDELEKAVNETDTAALQSVRDEMLAVRIIIIVQTIGVIFLVWLTSRLGIHPILNAVQSIKANKHIPEGGTKEFRYLVRAYNRLYEMYQKSLKRLNFKASHDELTGVFNRAGYDSILEHLDLENTYMILMDVDDFKHINDDFGHEIGDEVLIKLAQTLQTNFRSDDYVCRIGGDEFVVLMLHTSEMEHTSIAEKIDAVNRIMQQGDAAIPATSISAGIVHGSKAANAQELYEKADEAMYRSKRNGKRAYTFC